MGTDREPFINPKKHLIKKFLTLIRGTIQHRNTNNFFNPQSVFYFFGVTGEKDPFPNGRFSGCNLMRQSSNPKRDQFIRNIYVRGNA